MQAVHPMQNKGFLHMGGGYRCLETPVPKAEEFVALSAAAEDHHFLKAERIWLHASFLQDHRALSWKVPLEFVWANPCAEQGS